MLSWYDEPVALLRQAVRSAAVICDRIVAADGAYELVPNPKPESMRHQKMAILDEANKCGIKVSFLQPRIWPGQVAKRTAVLQRAKRGSHWVMVLDADWRISGDREAIRAELADLHWNGYEQIVVNFLTPDDPSRGWEEKAANEWHIQQAGAVQLLPFIYRTFPKMRYSKNHWSLLCEDKDGRRVAMFGLDGLHNWDRAKTGYLRSNHCFEHLCLHRKPKQIRRNSEYIRRRDEYALELGYET